MRIVEVTEFGGPQVLVAREAPDPVAGAGQVVIETAVADVLFLDTQLREGWGEGFFPMTPPYVPGDGVAGQVVSAGDGVDPAWVGRRVMARTGAPAGGSDSIVAPTGGYATRAVASVEALIPVPDGLELSQAVALLHDGPTATGFVDNAAIRPGEWVLITAAGGSLGIVLVQLALAGGARVIGAARGTRKLDLVRELGAEAAVDYTEDGWPERVRETTGGKGVDVVFDGAGGPLGRSALEVTASGGRFFAYGAASGGFAEVTPDEAAGRGVRLVGIMDQVSDAAEVRRLTERALAKAAAGHLRPYVGQTFPLERAADAHAAMAARTAIGKTLLVC